MRDAKPDRLIKALKAEGFEEISSNKHRNMVKQIDGKKLLVIVPYHKIIKRNTVESIRKQAQLPKEIFYAYKF